MSAATEEKQPIPTNQVFVGGMPPETTVEQLTKHLQSLKLSPAGAPTLFTTPAGVSRGCALVPFANADAVTAAITAIGASKIGDKELIARADRGPRKPRREVNQDGSYLYVGNLDPDITEDELRALFETEGKIVTCTISRKRRTERSLGWATVQLSSESEAKHAQEALNGKSFKERALTVEALKSIPRAARKPRARKDPAPAEAAPEQPQADPCIVWVGNLPFETTEETLRPIFEEHGEVKDVAITYDKRSKESRGWGTVTFASAEEATVAVEKLNETTIGERAIRVQIRRGPRMRRRRAQQPPAQEAEQTAEGEGKASKGPRRRFRRRPQGGGRRQGDEKGQPQTQVQETKQEGEGKQQGSRRRRPRQDKKEDKDEAVTMHVEGGEGEGDRPRRPRRRPRKRAEGATGGEAQPPRPRRERKEPDKVVANPGCHLYVRNVPFAAKSEELKAFFEEKAGTVVSAVITTNTKGRSRGWATVEMSSPQEAQKGLELDKSEFMERQLYVRVDNRVRGEA